jgi:predicted unusual protein kinase regulating ubiquinone biosynthesis (AarF/ABC1/UbiB family)
LQRKVVVGLAHNDLHGGNLLVDSQGLVWLIDFATVKQDQHVLMEAGLGIGKNRKDQQ